MATADTEVTGTLALLGGGEWGDGTRDLDARLLEASGAKEVVVLPTAAAFGHPDRIVEHAADHFRGLGAKTRELAVLHRREAESPEVCEAVRDARFVYFSDGSPLHLRSVLKGSPLFDALLAAYRSGAVVAASGAGATVLCDPMVDPRGGAYTVGLGIVVGVAVFPYHGTAADHLRERSIDLLPSNAVLAGVDEATALVREPGASWSVAGAGAVTLYTSSTDTTGQKLPSGTHPIELP
jgi:cyanophycinase